MVLGLALVASAALWLCTRPSLSTKARMLRSDSTVPLQETSVRPNNLPAGGLTTENVGNVKNNHLSIINNQSKRSHIVSKGETLSDISYRYYGSANKWRKILSANRDAIKDANKLTPGTKLIIPE